MIKSILVPVDGSQHAEKAVLLAADIAQKYDARLILLHVLVPGPVPEGLRHMAEVEGLTPARDAGPVAPVAEGKYPASLISAGRDYDSHEVLGFIGKRVLSDAERTAQEHGAPAVRTVLGEGDPAAQILETAEAEAANLIVMGSRGLSDLKGLLMGSVSSKVNQLSACTCVTVK